jgi:Protein of unknown function (DUF2911)
MKRGALFVVLLGGTFSLCFAQQTPAMSTTSCSFQDGKQISVRYDSELNEDKKALSKGRLWMPGGEPMWLFTQAALSVDTSEIPIGAYSMYIIPDKQDWILIVNKNVSAGRNYNEHEDLARVRMPLGQLSEPQKEFDLFFGHVAPKQCNMRIYYGQSGAWAEFKEK